MRTLTSRHRVLLLGLALATAILAQRESVQAASQAAGRRSTPVILSVLPALPQPASGPQTLRITGQDFQPRLKLVITTPTGESIELKEDAILQPRESSFQVAAVLASAGKYSLVVTNPDGGISAPFVLEARAVVKPPTPVIQRILPEEIVKNPEPQDVKVEGQNFGAGLHVTVMDPLGVEVLDPVVKDLTPTSFKLTVKLEVAGPYNLVVSNSTGAVSNVATITVK